LAENGFFQLTQKIFIRNHQSILVLRDRKSGVGDLPGGRMTEEEFFGDWVKSLERELVEELGENFQLQIDPDPIFLKKHRVEEGQFPCMILAYKGIYSGGVVQLSDEHDYFDWVDSKNFDPGALFSGYMLEAVDYYLKKYS